MTEFVSLYGGALRTVLPPGFIDASSLREVPDTQEVFVNARKDGDQYGDGLGIDESITVDLLERVDASSDAQALKVHVEEIFELNGSKQCEIGPIEVVDGSQTCIAYDSEIVLCVGLIRLGQHETDVVLTVNVPGREAPVRLQQSQGYKELPQNVNSAYRLLKSMIKHFQVLDSSLFVQ